MAAHVIPGAENDLLTPRDFSLELYKKALTVLYVEERTKVFACQNKCSFVPSSRGHELTQVGIVSLF